ncbi:MAG: hypothetical protein JNK64_42100, partial [Myxococcales bacterium]|nr:hypothetical protein [Myxococcales bacterium]
ATASRARVVGTDTIAQVPSADELAATRSLPRVTGAPRQPADLPLPPPAAPPRRATPRTMSATDAVTAVQAAPTEFDDGPTQLGWTGERRP